MRYLWSFLACVIYSGVAWGAPWLPPVRDGAWLQNGIKQQQRWNAQEKLSDQQTNDATIVTAYVCAVVDLEKDLVHRAALLAGALDSGKKKKQFLDPALLRGMRKAVPILIPLATGDFDAASLSCDRATAIVGDYLAKYPEMLDKEAESIVEKALMDAYGRPDKE
jgi:hypothetical protein